MSEFLPLPAGGLGRSKQLTIEVSNGCIKKKETKDTEQPVGCSRTQFSMRKKNAAGFANGASGLEGLRKKKTEKTLMT